jgi:hypothetical protein
MQPILLKKLQNIGVRSFKRRRGQLLHTSSLQQCRTHEGPLRKYPVRKFAGILLLFVHSCCFSQFPNM